MAREFIGQEYLAATGGRGLHEDSKPTRILVRVTITCSVLVTLLSVAVITCCIIFALCPVVGQSMMTTLNATGANTDSAVTCIVGNPNHGDIVVQKLYYYNTRYVSYRSRVEQGDRAAINIIKGLGYTESDNKGYYMHIVKRLIGKPLDEISMRKVDDNYYIYVNGEKLDESYLDPLVAHPSAENFIQLWNILNDKSLANMIDWVNVDYDKCVGENRYYMDPGEGIPSRNMLRVPSNYYFLMGDNRDGYQDSDGIKWRPSWDSTAMGPLPKANYVSRCVDIIKSDMSMPEYLWKKFVYYVCWGWWWQKH